MRAAPAAPFSRVDPKGNFARLDPSRGSELSMMASDLEFAARDAAICFKIALAGRVHHAGRQRRRRGVPVPAAGGGFGVAVIAPGVRGVTWVGGEPGVRVRPTER